MKTLLKMLFTSRCVLCGEVIDQKENICSACGENIERVQAPACQKCAESLFRCSCPPGRKTAYDSVSAVFLYRRSIKQGIGLFKFRGDTSGLDFFGGEMYKTYLRLYAGSQIDVIVPVPLFKSKERERGFNQSLLLAREISKRSGIPVKEYLKKIKETPDQHFLKRGDRERNLKGAFEGSKAARNKNILLIDDVITTGSTFNECARTLKETGANKIFALAAAVTSE